MPFSELEMLGSADTPVRKSVRRLRWFKETLHRQVQVLEDQTGITFETNDNTVRALFLGWLEAFEAQRPNDDQKREDYVNFAAGLMLRELIKSNPVKAVKVPQDADLSNPAYYWPEGYVYVALCLNICGAVMEQDFDIERHVSPEMEDVRTWWSFRENIAEDTNLAIGFFDLFAGNSPSWEMPSIFSARKSQNVAAKYFALPQNKKLTNL